jgi:hypothetical protein
MGRRLQAPIVGVATLLILALTLPGVHAYSQPWTLVDHELGPAWDVLRPLCHDVLVDLREEGVLGDHAARHQGAGFEGEWLRMAPECIELRDELQWTVWADRDKPELEECRAASGYQNCLAIGHWACDFALFGGSGLVYLCLGGIFPDN